MTVKTNKKDIYSTKGNPHIKKTKGWSNYKPENLSGFEECILDILKQSLGGAQCEN